MIRAVYSYNGENQAEGGEDQDDEQEEEELIRTIESHGEASQDKGATSSSIGSKEQAMRELLAKQ